MMAGAKRETAAIKKPSGSVLVWTPDIVAPSESFQLSSPTDNCCIWYAINIRGMHQFSPGNFKNIQYRLYCTSPVCYGTGNGVSCDLIKQSRHDPLCFDHCQSYYCHSAESENLGTKLGKYLGGVILLFCISHCVSGKYTLGTYCRVYHPNYVTSVDLWSFLCSGMLKATKIITNI